MRAAIATYAKQSSGISQNGAIAASLIIGFLVYLTIKGRLAAYVNLLFSSRGKGTSSVGTAQANVPSASSAAGAGSGSATQPLQGLAQPQPIAAPSGNTQIYDLQGNPNGFGDPNFAVLSGGGAAGVDTSTFGGTGQVVNPYSGPTFIDATSGF